MKPGTLEEQSNTNAAPNLNLNMRAVEEEEDDELEEGEITRG